MGILQKAGQLKPSGMLVFGLPSSGKSTFLLNELKGEKNVLWLSAGNLSVLEGNEITKNWMTGHVNTRDDMLSVLKDLNEGTVKPDVIVMESLESLRDFELLYASIHSKGDGVTQADWLSAGRELEAIIRQLGKKCNNRLYASVNVIYSDEANKHIRAVNPDVDRRLLTVFGRKVHVFTKPVYKKVEGTKVIDRLDYLSVEGEFAVRLKNLN